MKMKLFCMLICISNLIILPGFAESSSNNCIANFNNHIINSDTAWFDECELNDKDVPIIISYLETHKQITQLYLLHNNISDQGAILLSRNKSLKLLELRNNLIGKKGATALAHSSIHVIDLKGNKFEQEHLVSVAENNSSRNIRTDEVIILV